jgi:hypothetical protein
MQRTILSLWGGHLSPNYVFTFPQKLHQLPGTPYPVPNLPVQGDVAQLPPGQARPVGRSL